jgi:cbb3-type cytochrome oxidase cytochrome c subunit
MPIMASIGFFRRAQCGSCRVGPDLTASPSSRPPSWLEEHMKSNPKAPGVLTDAQVQTLVTFVTKRSDKAVDAWRNAPQGAVEGALVYQAHACASCHRLNGAGNDLGPPLNGVGERRDRAWIEGHFANPPEYSSGSIMPSSQFKPDQLKLITDYIMAIPK